MSEKPHPPGERCPFCGADIVERTTHLGLSRWRRRRAILLGLALISCGWLVVSAIVAIEKVWYPMGIVLGLVVALGLSAEPKFAYE